jgi:hypothetical protein
MSKLKAFVRLDFMTVKPYFTTKNLLIFAAVAIFLSVMSDTVNMSLGIGAMLGTLLIGYPFAVGEKSNMDALYSTLAIGRNTVVLGRYLFALALNICAVVFSYVCATLGLFVARILGSFPVAAENNPVSLITAVAALMVLIQVIQMPVFFKLGYTKAKILAILPFAALMAGFGVVNSIARDPSNRFDGVREFFTKLEASGFAIPLAAAVLLTVIYASYCLSVTFYRKREF